MNNNVDLYLQDGCGRCEHYKTPTCNVHSWNEVLHKLRELLLKSSLKEEYKWSQPCYTYNGHNVVMISALKNNAVLSFFKGSLLKDDENILDAPGPNSQAARYLKLTSIDQLQKLEPQIIAYIDEAVEIEKQGKKVVFKKNPEPIPEELKQKFEEDPAFESAFFNLTPGRQRGYIIHFSQPKQSKTRTGRIEKHYPNILNGLGINDLYKLKNK